MVYILSEQLDNADDGFACLRHYRKYLDSARGDFPSSAYQLANANWYHDFSDHRCPHDARLEELAITESPPGERGRSGGASIRIRLLGAYTDGHVHFFYPRVFSYQLSLTDGTTGHHDWRYDELRLNEAGHVIHEIEWWHSNEVARWMVESSDIEYEWHPFE